MSAQHTPGPWSFTVDGARKIVAPSTNELTRTCDTLMCDMQYYPWCPDKDADWHLIAAAPDLLDALIALRRAELEDWDSDEDIQRLRRQAEAAIAKALGSPA